MPADESSDVIYRWQETEPGIWKRDIDEYETFLRSLAGARKLSHPVTASAAFHLDDALASSCLERIEDVFTAAWLLLRDEHPNLSSRIEQDASSKSWKRVYSTLGSRPIEQARWLKSTFKVIDTDLEPLDWFNKEAPRVETATLFFVRMVENTVEHRIFLTCPRDITDSIGVLLVLNRLFTHAAAQLGTHYQVPATLFADEYLRLSPCLKVAIGAPQDYPETDLQRFAELERHNREVCKHPGLLGLSKSTPDLAPAPGHMHRKELRLSTTETNRVLRGCKSLGHGFSVTHVVTSAVAMVLRDQQPKTDSDRAVRFVIRPTINLRPYCQNLYDSAAHSAAPHHTIVPKAFGVDLTVPGAKSEHIMPSVSAEMSRISTGVRDYYRSVRPSPDSETEKQVVLAPLIFKSITPPTETYASAADDPPFCPVTLTSLGDISSMVSAEHGPLQLDRVWANSEPIGAGVALFLSAWDGQMELASIFDSSYHDVTHMAELLTRIVECLLNGLDSDGNSRPAMGEASRNVLRRKHEGAVDCIGRKAPASNLSKRARFRAPGPEEGTGKGNFHRKSEIEQRTDANPIVWWMLSLI